jgi:GntR family transcriptional regulator, transcriptional repressor for pyruvate dehydrogenase complex
MISLKKERVSMMVTDVIKEIIKTEGFKSGDKFYSENQLSKRLEVSRSSIREAIRMLEVTGWVAVYQGKGIFISEPGADAGGNGETENADLPIKRWVVDNTELLREHFEVRMLIEPHAAALAADLADAKDLDALDETYQSFCTYVKEGNVIKAISSDGSFHRLVARASRNRTLSILMKTMAETLNEGWYTTLNIPGRLERTIEEHGGILESIKQKAPEEAAGRMRRHLLNALDDIQKHFGKITQ